MMLKKNMKNKTICLENKKSLRVDLVNPAVFRIRLSEDGKFKESGLNRYGIIKADECAGDPRSKPVIISDLSVCQPPEALATRRGRGHWKVLPYTTSEFSGKCVHALFKTGAPELTLPLNAKGWHAVYLGLGRGFSNVESVVRVKLSDDIAFQHRMPKEGPCAGEEVLFKCADLTGQSLHIAQQSAGLSREALVYYVKLVPLTDAEVAAVQRERCEPETKRLIGTIDGSTFLYSRMPTTKAELLEQFEPFRDSDFGTIWWAYAGADLVNYRSRLGTIPGTRTDDFAREGDRCFTKAVQTLIAAGIDITKVAVDACHDMGMDIHISMRPGAWSGPVHHGMEDWAASDFFLAHPEWRCRDRAGRWMTKMSFAVPEVRQHLLGIFREVLESGPDGVNILYNRGMPLIVFEDAFCDRFRELHGEDARTVPENDPRIYDLRAELLTQWMREVRQLLDEFQRERGLKKRLALSAMCLPRTDECRIYGLDVACWVREGLIDQIGVKNFSTEPFDIAWYKSITAGTGIPVYPGMTAHRQPNTQEVLRRAVEWMDAGADGLLFWDPEVSAIDGLYWPMVSRMGHLEETRARLAANLSRSVFQITGMGDAPGGSGGSDGF